MQRLNDRFEREKRVPLIFEGEPENSAKDLFGRGHWFLKIDNETHGMAARSCSITLFDGNKLSACHEIYYPAYPRGVADARPVRARKRKNPGHIRGPPAIYICRERRKGRRDESKTKKKSCFHVELRVRSV